MSRIFLSVLLFLGLAYAAARPASAITSCAVACASGTAPCNLRCYVGTPPSQLVTTCGQVGPCTRRAAAQPTLAPEPLACAPAASESAGAPALLTLLRSWAVGATHWLDRLA